jgi:hypothetical protein
VFGDFSTFDTNDFQAKMVAHEMRLPLPCDEGLWSATSAAEVARVQSSLQTNGIKPTMFLDGKAVDPTPKLRVILLNANASFELRTQKDVERSARPYQFLRPYYPHGRTTVCIVAYEPKRSFNHDTGPPDFWRP